MTYNFQQWMSWLPQRWRTQRNAIRNTNCKTSWIIKILNAHCAPRNCLGAYLSECSWTPLNTVNWLSWVDDPPALGLNFGPSKRVPWRMLHCLPMVRLIVGLCCCCHSCRQASRHGIGESAAMKFVTKPPLGSPTWDSLPLWTILWSLSLSSDLLCNVYLHKACSVKELFLTVLDIICVSHECCELALDRCTPHRPWKRIHASGVVS